MTPAEVEAETALVMRVRGATVATICDTLGLGLAEVEAVIRTAASRGDPRALSDREAGKVRADLGGAASARSEMLRAAVVARCHALAALWRGRNPQATAGLLHLADLYQHCDRRYPEHDIPPEDEARAVITARAAYGAGYQTACGSVAADCVLYGE